MDNFDKLHKDQDDFIKGVFHEDKMISQPVLDSFETYLEKTKIKVDRYTHKQKKIILLLVVLLLISVAFNIYLALHPEANIFKNIKLPTGETDKSNTTIVEEQEEPNTEVDDVVEVNKNEVIDNTVSNTVSNTVDSENTVDNENTVTNGVANEVTNTTIVLDPPKKPTIANVTKVPEVEKDYTGEFDVEAFKKELEKYSLGINRISYGEQTLESNTILLALTKSFFNSHANDEGLDVGTKYTQSVANMHKYLKELTGKDFGTTPLQSYNNYIGFAQSTKSYLYGKDISILQKEEYKVTDLKVSEKHGNSYTATAKVTRTLDYIDTIYEVEVEFKINKEYTYQQFNIISLKAKNTSFFPANTVRLVD